MSVAQRLQEAIIGAGVAVTGVSIGVRGDASTVKVEPESLQAAAQATIDAFDWSQVAHNAWLEDQNPERKAVRQQAAAAIADNNTFLAIASPINAQTLAQVKRLTQQMNKLIPFVVKLS